VHICTGLYFYPPGVPGVGGADEPPGVPTGGGGCDPPGVPGVGGGDAPPAVPVVGTLEFFALLRLSSKPNVAAAIERMAHADIITTRPIIPKVICFTPSVRAVELLAFMMYSAQPHRNTRKATADRRPMSGKTMKVFNAVTKFPAFTVAMSIAAWSGFILI